MKIIRVTEDQFDSIWNKLTPMQRTNVGVADRNIALYAYNAMVIVADDLPILDLPDLGDNLSLAALHYFAKNLTMEGYVSKARPPSMPMSVYYEYLAKEAKKNEDAEAGQTGATNG